MKKITVIILSMAMAITMLAACGSAADKAYVEWADQNVEKIEQASRDYTAAATAAGSDAAAALAAIDTYLAVLNSAKSSFDRLDYNGLNSENKSKHDEQRQNLETGLTEFTAARADVEAFLAAEQQQEDDGEEYYYDDDEYYDEDDE